MKRKPVIDWDGKHLPKALRSVPPGRYVLAPADDGLAPTPGEEKGIIESLDDLDAGNGRTLADVLSEIRGRSRRK